MAWIAHIENDVGLRVCSSYTIVLYIALLFHMPLCETAYIRTLYDDGLSIPIYLSLLCVCLHFSSGSKSNIILETQIMWVCVVFCTWIRDTRDCFIHCAHFSFISVFVIYIHFFRFFFFFCHLSLSLFLILFVLWTLAGFSIHTSMQLKSRIIYCLNSSNSRVRGE